MQKTAGKELYPPSFDLNFPSPAAIFFVPSTVSPLQYYQKAKIYFQPSYREGLPNTLCEAMLCECVPVGTKAGGIPEAIGTTGIIVDYGNAAAAAEAINNAMKMNTGSQARERIKLKYPKEKREKELTRLIESLTND